MEKAAIPISLLYLELKLLHLTRDFGDSIERLDQEDVVKYYKKWCPLNDDDCPEPWKRSPENQKFIKKYYSDLIELSYCFPKQLNNFKNKYLQNLRYYDHSVEVSN